MAAGGLKISTKGKMYFLEGMQETVSTFQNKECVFIKKTMPNKEVKPNKEIKSNKEPFFCHNLSKICLHKTDEKGNTKNKLCQITTSYQNTQMCHGVSTDTTSDRPCCCAPKEDKLIENHYLIPEHRCVSELVTPLIVNHGMFYPNCVILKSCK